MRKNILSGLIAFVSLTSTAQKKIEVGEYDLPKGIHLIFQEEQSTPIFRVLNFFQ